MNEQVEENKARVRFIIEDGDNLTDDDGYPTDLALEAIEKWHWEEARGWFEFIGALWSHKDYGWYEKDEPHDYKQNVTVHRYYISTAGWSGNESIVKAMEKNYMMWLLNWVQSRRGGHYIFELKEFENEQLS